MGAVVFLIVAWLIACIVCSVIAVQKGKVWMMVCGWLFFNPLIVIAACRIAKPNSSWAMKNYAHDPMKQTISKTRFPKEAFYLKALEAQTPAG